MSLTNISHCFEFFWEGWRPYFCHLNTGKVPLIHYFSQLHLKNCRWGFIFFMLVCLFHLFPFLSHLSKLMHVCSICFFKLAHVLSICFFKLMCMCWVCFLDQRQSFPQLLYLDFIHIFVVSWTWFKSPSWPSPRVSPILTICCSWFTSNCYWLVFCKSWECIREEGEYITLIHGRLTALILK